MNLDSVADDLIWLVSRDVVGITDIKEEPGWAAYIRCNDVFGYACADAQEVPLDQPGRVNQLRTMFERYGYDGVYAWIAMQRGQLPLENRLKTKQFEEAYTWLQSIRG